MVGVALCLCPVEERRRFCSISALFFVQRQILRVSFLVLQLMKLCNDEELMEVVLPRLSQAITTFEFLLMRVERGRPLRPHIQDVLAEFEKLQKQVSLEVLSGQEPRLMSVTGGHQEV